MKQSLGRQRKMINAKEKLRNTEDRERSVPTTTGGVLTYIIGISERK